MPSKLTKSQKTKQSKEPVIVRDNVTVRDCMTWHYPDGYRSDQVAGAETKDFYLATKPDIGQTKSRGYEHPPVVQYSSTHDENGRVIDALRGWPHNDADQLVNEGQFLYPEKQQSGERSDKKGDPWMGDLMAHKFMTDAVRRRKEEEAAAAKKAAGRSKSGRGQADIKVNRAAQLRAIALAEKVEVAPHELWQMPKFKKNARPHLSTQTRRVHNRNNPDLNGTGDTDGGDPCTCYDPNQGLSDDIKVPDKDPEYVPYYDGNVDNNIYPDYEDDTDDNKLFAV